VESIYVSKDYFQITNFKNLNDFFLADLGD